MKKLFILAALCLAAMVGSAQTGSDQATATLQSGDKVSVFYGHDALKYAYEAARDSGDVITLSAGLFNALEIQKSLHIIGNGFVKDEANGKYPTIIKGDLTFRPGDVTDDDGETTSEAIGYDGTRIEGIMHIGYDRENIELLGSRTVKDFSFVKCKLTRGCDVNVNTKGLTIRQCVIADGVYLQYLDLCEKAHENLYIVGSYIDGIGYHTSDGIVTMDHSILRYPLNYGKVTNSILSGVAQGVMAENCIFMENTPEYVIGAGNWFDCQYADIFKNDITELNWNDAENYFELKYPAEYTGTDGTQVGLYGGPYPYNPTPTIPQIKENNIDTTVGADGILKVSVTVEAQTEN